MTAMNQGKIDLALVGGVHANLSHFLSGFMYDHGMLSEHGCCRPFDEEADGFVRGEGCGVIILKQFSSARECGDRIWGIIKGTAVNQTISNATLTAPHRGSQEEVIQSALSDAGIAACDVDYLEAHGSSSKLGDPIEIQAAGTVYGEGRDADRPLLVGTVKTNIGHLEPASGIAGVIKVLLAMHHGVIPPQLHFQNPNPNIDWTSLPVKVVSEKVKWPSISDRPPRGGISAFGLFGANAHVIVEGYQDTNSQTLGSSPDESPPAI